LPRNFILQDEECGKKENVKYNIKTDVIGCEENKRLEGPPGFKEKWILVSPMLTFRSSTIIILVGHAAWQDRLKTIIKSSDRISMTQPRQRALLK
jgi:hypothetical protein